MADYDNVAELYSNAMPDEGDYYHRTQIDPLIYSIIGDPKGKIIYDLGCGNGYIARNLSRKGAKVYASDISSKLIEIAEERSQGLDISYAAHDALKFDKYKKGMFDVVVMNMVIHYIKDINKLFRGISRVLKKDGIFVFSTNHPFRPVHPYSEWTLGKIDEKETLFIKVTGYLKKESREGICWCDNKTKLHLYNQPLHELVNTMSKYGLLTFRIEEPKGDGFAHDYSKELQDSHYIPTFIIIGTKRLDRCGNLR
ncbi:MAG TPA: class I SAM-dependent methyltransferase [Candidatus Bathyarchaeia archaeon]|nr:class I SAM-dependent methyltransferase [Candidatus Bathyarchaeia archaeon]